MNGGVEHGISSETLGLPYVASVPSEKGLLEVLKEVALRRY